MSTGVFQYNFITDAKFEFHMLLTCNEILFFFGFLPTISKCNNYVCWQYKDKWWAVFDLWAVVADSWSKAVSPELVSRTKLLHGLLIGMQKNKFGNYYRLCILLRESWYTLA